MAFGPIFAYMIYNDNRTFDLFLSSSFGGVLCGVFKHLFRTPRPCWIVPEVVLFEIHVTNFIIHHIMIYSVLINTNIQPCFYISGPSETRCGGNELGNPICTFCYSG